MFSGIIEETTKVKSWNPHGDVYALSLVRPRVFDDLDIGDSVAVNGACLTLESQTSDELFFSVGPETLRVLGWASSLKVGDTVNLERSLRMGARIHGHLVSGHVESLGQITLIQDVDGARFLEISVPLSAKPLVWKKGSIAINGVSLTINEVKEDQKSCVICVCLIPETLRKTNLGILHLHNSVGIEPDLMARGLLRLRELGIEYSR